MKVPELTGTIALLIGAAWLASWEIRGVVSHTATITGLNRFAQRWLKDHFDVAYFIYHIAVIGLAFWATLHLGFGLG